MPDVFTSNIMKLGFQPGVLYNDELFEFFELVLDKEVSADDKERGGKLRKVLERKKEMYPTRRLLAIRATPLAIQNNAKCIGALYRFVDDEVRLFDLSEVMIYNHDKKTQS